MPLEDYNNVYLEIIDITGRKLYTTRINEEKSEVDLKSFRSGIYFVIIKGDGKFLNSKSFIVKK